MSRDQCCVPGCRESGSSHQVLHGFPNPEIDPDRFREWVNAVGGDILGLNNHYIYKQRRVCHGHFDKKYCCRYNRISNIAVPTINMPSPIDIPKFTIVERRPLQGIHNVMLDCPSTFKDPVVYAENTFNIIENVMGCGKENIHESAGTSVIQAMQSQKPVDTMDVDNFQEVIHLEKRGTKRQRSGYDNPPPCKTLTRRIALTTTEKKLYKHLVTVKVKLSKCRSKIKKQKLELKAARNIFSNQKFVSAMESFTTSAKLLTLMQFREIKKKDKGRRFSNEEKIVALTLYRMDFLNLLKLIFGLLWPSSYARKI